MANVTTIRVPKRASAGAIGVGKKIKSKTAKIFFIGAKMALVTSLAMCFLLLMLVRGAVSKSGCNIVAAETQNKKLLAENRSLQEEWQYLKSPSRIEELAKRELGLQHPSKEQLIVIRH